jgi:hypothetical protein
MERHLQYLRGNSARRHETVRRFGSLEDVEFVRGEWLAMSPGRITNRG